MATSAMGTVFRMGEGETGVTVGKLTTIGEISPESKEMDVTTLDSPGGYREYMQGVKDAGEVELKGFLDADDAGQAALMQAFYNGSIESCSVQFRDGTEAKFRAFVKSYSIGAAEVDKAVEFAARLRLTGEVTVE